MLVPSVLMSPNGPHVSQLVAGFWRLRHWDMTPQSLLEYLEQLLELGITTVDHAMVYRSEKPFGEALKIAPGLRDRMKIITKCGIRPAGYGELGASEVNHYDSGYAAILRSVDHSLKLLQCDYIDVLLLHRPDYLMDAPEVAEAFSRLKEQGKVQYFGVSNFNTHQLDYLQRYWSDGLVTNQVELSPLNLQWLDSGGPEQCARLDIRPMLWSCLAGGEILQPKDARGHDLLSALRTVAREHDVESIEAVIYAWLLRLPSKPLPMLGTRSIARAKAAVAGINLQLNREQWYRIWEASTGHPVP